MLPNFSELLYREGAIAVPLVPKILRAFYRLLSIIKTGNVIVSALSAGYYSGVVRIRGDGVSDFDATEVLVTYGFRGLTGFLNACGRYG